MKYLVILLTILLVSCSRSSDQIEPAPVVGTPYAGFSCRALVDARIDLMNELTELRIAQNRRAAQDFASVAMIGVPLTAANASGDNEAAIAIRRGRVIEIDNQARKSGCSDPVFGSPEPEVTLEREVPRRN